MAQIIVFIYRVILQVIRIYSFVWFVWIILGWLNAFGVVNVNYYNPLIKILAKMTDGLIDRVFGSFRYKFVVGMLDLAPLIFLLFLTMVVPFLLSALFKLILGFIG